MSKMFCLDNADYLSYALRSAERKLKAGSNPLAGEQLTLGVLRGWLSGWSGQKLLGLLDNFSGSPADYQLLLPEFVRLAGSHIGKEAPVNKK